MRNNVLLSDVKDVLFYVFGTFIVTYFFWGLIVFANNRDLFLYGSRYFYVLFILGGIAPTVFGYIVSKKNGNVKNAFFLIKECYKLKQTVLNYAILGLFLVLTFITPVFSGKATYHVSSWYCFFLLIIKMIFFGGLEEVGWRYTVQPILEKYMSFTNSSFVISIMWSLWHLPLFFITGMNKGMDFGLFYIGVLGMSFALGAIFHISKSLWLCVLFHALVNAFSQVILVKPDLYINGFSTVIRIVFAALVVYMINRRNCKDHKRIFG